MSVIQPQWGLETTANGMFQLSRELMIACTSDNVQPLAILACQRFGNTLAISPETCRRVERLVLPSPEPVTIRFLKATVGFYKDDCATHLGSNEAGVRFLALASALVNSLGLGEATKAVHAMIRETAADSMLVPIFTHIYALMKSIEARCHRSGFMNDVVGYDILFFQDSDDSILSRSPVSKPSSKMIERLVEAFRQLGRIGSSEIFWPYNYGKGGGCMDRRIHEMVYRPPSNVTVRIPTGYCNGLSILTKYNIGTPIDLIVPREDKTTACHGMVSIDTFGSILLARLRPYVQCRNSDLVLEEILNLIPYTLRLFRALGGETVPNSQWTVCPLDPLPSNHHIAEACARLFSLTTPPDLRTCDNDFTPTLGPELFRCLSQCEGCSCPVGFEHQEGLCKDEFIGNIADLIVNVIYISFFEPFPDHQLHLSAEADDGHLMLLRAVHDAIWELWSPQSRPVGKISTNITDLYEYMECSQHKLLDYDSDSKVVMFSRHGQVVYPLILEQSRIPVLGHSRKAIIPGNLRFLGSAISSVLVGVQSVPWGPHLEYGLTATSSDHDHTLPPLSKLTDYFPGVKVYWKIEQSAEDTVTATFSVRKNKREASAIHIDPTQAIESLKNVISLESCPHDPRSNPTEEDANVFLGGLVPNERQKARGRKHRAKGTVMVIPTAGAEELRLFAFASWARYYEPCSHKSIKAVFRGRACLACCLELCREVDAPVLLL